MPKLPELHRKTAANPLTKALDWRQFSHELRTPLNAILGNVELLLDGSAGPLSAEARACLGEVQIASRQLSRHVQILLLWSEACVPEANRGGSPVDIIALIRELRATGYTEALPIEPPNARLLVCGDRLWLQTLIAEIVELGGAPRTPTAPTIRLESNAKGRALGFSWPHFRAADVEPLQMALIEAITRLHEAAAVLTSNGLRLYWPAAQLAGPRVTTEVSIRAGEADPPNGAAGGRSGRPE
jgi:His Kinase A (phospho-acceptor) domain